MYDCKFKSCLLSIAFLALQEQSISTIGMNTADILCKVLKYCAHSPRHFETKTMSFSNWCGQILSDTDILLKIELPSSHSLLNVVSELYPWYATGDASALFGISLLIFLRNLIANTECNVLTFKSSDSEIRIEAQSPIVNKINSNQLGYRH